MSENSQTKDARGSHCSGTFGVHVILLPDGSARVRGGHDEMAMKLLFRELEQHLKR